MAAIFSFRSFALTAALLPAALSAQTASPAAHSLSLQEALAAAVDNNPDIRVLRLDRAQQDARVAQARANFDPVLGAAATASYNESLGAVPPAGGNPNDPANPYYASYFTTSNRRKSLELGVSRNLEWGGSVKLDYTAARSKSNPVYSFIPGAAALNPNFTSGITFSIVQPLLAGAGFDAASLNLRLARLARTGTLADSSESLQMRLIEVERAYWALLAAQENYQVTLEARTLAQTFLGDTQARIKAGTIAPIEEVTAEAGVANNEETVITAENRWRSAEDNLRRLIAPGNPALFAGEIHIDPPTALSEPKVDIAAALQAAHANRPARASMSARAEEARLNAKAARRNRLPRLDLSGSYGGSGSTGPVDFEKRFSGDPSDPAQNAGTGWSGANSQAFGRKLENWSVGLNFSWAIGNRGPSAAYTDARIAQVKAEAGLESYDAGLELEVRNAARNYESGYKRVLAAQANHRLQERKLDAEKTRYQNGLSTSYQVLQFQNDLSSARSAEIAALTDYQLARSALETATGNYLRYRNITLTDLPAPE